MRGHGAPVVNAVVVGSMRVWREKRKCNKEVVQQRQRQRDDSEARRGRCLLTNRYRGDSALLVDTISRVASTTAGAIGGGGGDEGTTAQDLFE